VFSQRRFLFCVTPLRVTVMINTLNLLSLLPCYMPSRHILFVYSVETGSADVSCRRVGVSADRHTSCQSEIDLHCWQSVKSCTLVLSGLWS